MAKHIILLALLIVGGFAFPTINDDASDFEEDMSIFFDHSEEEIEGFIIGGNTAAEGAYPWMVAMTNGAQRSFLCGGSVVNPRRVLTAAHCIRGVVSGNTLSATLRVTVGTNRWNSGGQTFALSGFRNHPQFNPSTLNNDIGVLITSTNIVMSARVRAIPLSYDFVGGNVPCRVSGWGRTRVGGPGSVTLQELRKNTVTGQFCVTEVARVARQLNVRVPTVDPNLEICTFLAVNRGTCHGDSGSALVRNSNNAQIGIVAWGLPCARGAPDVYARISAFRNWLPTVL